MTNASATIWRKGAVFNQTTGRREQGDQDTILSNWPCLFSQAPGSKLTYQNGLREAARAFYSVILEDVDPTVVIQVGDIVQINLIDHQTNYFVTDAVPVQGIANRGEWQLTVDAVKVPTE